MLQKKDKYLGYSSSLVNEPSHPCNIQLLTYWEQHRLPGGPLLRENFDPLDIPRILPGIFIVEPAGDDFRFRLAGSDMEGRMRRTIADMTLTEVFGSKMGPTSIEITGNASSGTEPVILQGHYMGDNLEHIKFEVMHLPLQFADGSRGVLGGQFAFD